MDDSSVLGVANAANEFSKNSFFHRLMRTGDISYFAARTFSVSDTVSKSVSEA
jgi:hypothetical protein